MIPETMKIELAAIAVGAALRGWRLAAEAIGPAWEALAGERERMQERFAAFGLNERFRAAVLRTWGLAV